jgi:Cft2 family RNA processing exonuclease
VQLAFPGAAGEVTGSRCLAEVGAKRLLVDRGMFQGGRDAAARNGEPWGCSPHDLDAVVLSRAHIGSPRLRPRLTRNGFRGQVYATQANGELVETVSRALNEKRRNALGPAFAAGHAREPLYRFERLTLEDVVDSSLATEATEISARHLKLVDAQARRLIAVARRESRRVHLRHTRTVAESMARNRLSGSAVILAANSKCGGGRSKHQLRHRLPSPRTTVLITGFRAAGTIDRRLVAYDPTAPMSGEIVPVRAEFITLGGFSTRAGQGAPFDWLRGFGAPPSRTWRCRASRRRRGPFRSACAPISAGRSSP